MPLCIKEVPPEVGYFVKCHFRYNPESGLLYRTKTYRKGYDLTKPVGSLNSQGYLDVDLGMGYGEGKVRNTRVHRVAWFLTYDYWPEFQLDHIDGDKTNNKIDNLRPTDQRLNQANRSARKNVTSKYKGVGFNCGRWRAYICDGGSYKSLGAFDDEVSAAKAYDEAASKVFGCHARLNFPVDGGPSAFHDETVTVLDKGCEDETVTIMKQSIETVNEKLKLNVSLDVDPQFGLTYAQIH